jgi:prolyl 4-hydroxylase
MQQPRPSPVAQAVALAAAGRVPQAVMLLTQAGAAGDRASLYQLGAWKLEARLVPRDFAQSRELFRRSAQAGSHDAAVVYANFVANGTGGAANWQRGLALLRPLAARDPSCRRRLDLIEAMELTPAVDPISLPAGELLCAAPHVELFRGLFTPAECAYLIDSAEPILAPSVVVDPATGRDVPHPGRTSEMAGFTWQLEDPVVHALNRRLAALSGTDVTQGEPLQVLRYRPGQEYKPHIDAIPGTDNPRTVTILVYLNEEYEGGETYFTAPGLSVRGRLGDALLFRTLDANGRPNLAAEHAGMPVTGGTKLIASRWIHARPYVAPADKGYI